MVYRGNEGGKMRDKRYQELHWHSTKDKLDLTEVRASIKAHLVIIKVAKWQYFSILIMSAVCHSAGKGIPVILL